MTPFVWIGSTSAIDAVSTKITHVWDVPQGSLVSELRIAWKHRGPGDCLARGSCRAVKRYEQIGSPSAVDAVPTEIAHVFDVPVCVVCADQPVPPVAAIEEIVTPVDVL